MSTHPNSIRARGHFSDFKMTNCSVNENGSRGVMTAAGANYFPGLQHLWESISQFAPSCSIACVDLGLNTSQRDWCRSHDIQLIEMLDVVPIELLDAFSDKRNRSQTFQQSRLLWPRPWLVDASPFENTLWIDADAIVIRSLSELFPEIEKDVVVFTDANHPPSSPNHPKLYQLLPVHEVTAKFVNSGVLGVQRGRDNDLIASWKYCVEQAATRLEVRRLISWHDQGALLWALHKTMRTHLIRQDVTWNCPPHGFNASRRSERKRYPRATFLKDLQRDHPEAGIVHYMSRPKLWELVD